MNCAARQYSDQMQCARCALAWDVNDPDPPKCLTAEAISRARGNATLERVRAMLAPKAVLPREMTDRWHRYWGQRRRMFVRQGVRFEVTETGAKVYRNDELVRIFTLADTPVTIDEALEAI